jgi:hypothetical protein
LRQRRKLQRAASAKGASAAKQQAPKARAQQSSKRQRREHSKAASAKGASAAKQQAPKARAQQSSKRQRREHSKAASAKGASTNRKRESAPSKFAQRTPSKAQRAAKQAPKVRQAQFSHTKIAQKSLLKMTSVCIIHAQHESPYGVLQCCESPKKLLPLTTSYSSPDIQPFCLIKPICAPN